MKKGSDEKIKVSIISNIPTPYRLPFWDKIAGLVDLSVVCISPSEKNRDWGCASREYLVFLKSFHIYSYKLDFAFHFSFPFSLFSSLMKADPDVVVITGYDNYQYWEALLYSRIYSKKCVLWSGTTLLSSKSNNGFIGSLKRFFISQFDGYYTYGKKATEYLIELGAKNNIVTGCNVVDTDVFRRSIDVFPSSLEKPSQGNKFIYVGQLIERKGLVEMLGAFRKILKLDWSLEVVGDGPLRQELEDFVNSTELSGRVNFVGSLDQNALINEYSKSDILIMPSKNEVWGLVINEAVAAGLFVISSKYAGATHDLVTQGENGLFVDPNSVSSLSVAYERSINMKKNKVFISSTLSETPETQSQVFLKAINYALI